MSDIFISHVEENSDIAFQIAAGLEASGYSTWYYERDSLPGPSYLLQTSREIELSQAVVLIISPDSLSSHQVTAEVIRAHESGKPFVPVLKDISHIEFSARQPEWKEAVGSATSVSVPREGTSVIIPRILQGLRGMGIEPSGTDRVTAPGEFRIASTRKPLFRLGRLKVFPFTAVIGLLILGAVAAGASILTSKDNKTPSPGATLTSQQPITTYSFEPAGGNVSAADALDAATTDLNTSLGALRVTKADLSTEACPPPDIPEKCRVTTGNNRFLVLELQGSGGGDIGLTTAFTTEAHASTVDFKGRRYGASSVYYDEASGKVDVVYGVLPAESAAGPLLLVWQENPPLRLTVTT